MGVSLSSHHGEARRRWMSQIDCIYFINLAHRFDRRKEIENFLFHELELPRDKVQRWDAVADPQVPRRGCTKSHLGIIQDAIEKKHRRIIIMEDDLKRNPTELVSHFHQKLTDALEYLDCVYHDPAWSVLFLGMTPIRLDNVTAHVPSSSSTHHLRTFAQKPSSVKKQLVRVRSALAMCGYVVNHSYFHILAQIFQRALIEEIEHDRITQLYQGHHLWFGFFPPLAIQGAGFSDIEKRVVDYHPYEVEGIKMIR